MARYTAEDGVEFADDVRERFEELASREDAERIDENAVKFGEDMYVGIAEPKLDFMSGEIVASVLVDTQPMRATFEAASLEVTEYELLVEAGDGSDARVWLGADG